ncbi:MAG TPA: YfhO family protein, partial [Chitinophagaceae bacterium]|nr:YfhO family protein [Chitinophagaceae bacterium]
MKNINWRKILPHAVAVVIFIVIAALFCKPALEGKVLYQHDIVQYEGGSKDIANYVAKHGDAPLWTNSMFSGMPTYQIWMPANNVLPHYVNKILTLGLPQPMQFFFLACLLFYFLSQVARVNPYIGIFGALAFGYSTYNPVMISAGHVTQMWVVAYMPAILASVMLIYRKKYLIGTGLLALFTATQVGLNHLQVTYYLFIILGLYTIFCIVRWIKDKQYAHMIKALGFTAVAVLIGVMVNSVTLLTTYEYAKETIRGGTSPLEDSTATKSTGLSKDYAFEYSYKPLETFTVMFPRIYGGSIGIREIGEDSKVARALGEMNPQLAQQVQQAGLRQNSYWGSLTYTAGPPYFGAIVCFLFIVFLFFVKGEIKWWILTASVLALFMSWGKYFSGFNYFLFDHFPLYNKFRAPSMSLIIPQLLWPFAAILALQNVITNANNPDTWKKLKRAGIATAALIVIVLFAYLSLDYMDEGSKQLKKQVLSMNQAQISEPVLNTIKALVEDRKSVFLSDILKAIALIGIFFGVLSLYVRRKIQNPIWVYVAAILLTLIDLIPVDNTYLNKTPDLVQEAYQEPEESKQELVPRMADQQILKDTGWYRVLNLAVSPFQDATTSSFHKSLGGYHAAKISRYQDLWTHKIVAETEALRNDSLAAMGLGLNQTTYTGLNMLNTKYIIGSNPPATSNQRPFVLLNPNALGPTWFVREIRFANDQKDEMKLLNGLDASKVAIVSVNDKNKVTQPVYDSTAKIELVKNDNDIITYKSTASSTQFAVFSEVYYSEGWNAYIDGKKTDYVKTNYTLRGLSVPAGTHTIEFKFEPASYKKGRSLTAIG